MGNQEAILELCQQSKIDQCRDNDPSMRPTFEKIVEISRPTHYKICTTNDEEKRKEMKIDGEKKTSTKVGFCVSS